MNILCVNHYAGAPGYGMEYRPYYLAREWVRQGHTVRIVASGYSHLRPRQPDLAGKRWSLEHLDGVTYEWHAGHSYQGNGIGRVRNILDFLRALRRAGPRLVREVKPDVVIASSTYPMDIWPASRIARMANARLVYEVHDLWPLSPMELGGMSRWHPFIMWAQRAENFAYRTADLVVSLLPNPHEHMAAHALDLKKLVIVPNGISPAEWSETADALPVKTQQQLQQIRKESTAIIGYAGSHGVANALDRMLGCAAEMSGSGAAFVLVGNGPEKARLMDEASRRQLHNVHFLESVPKQAVPELLSWFDVAFISLQAQPLFRFGVSPNKLFDYMMAARPVVQCIDAPPGPVAHSGCGICVSSDDPRAAATAIRRLLELSPAERKQMGEKGRQYVLAEHIYPVLARRFLEALPDGR